MSNATAWPTRTLMTQVGPVPIILPQPSNIPTAIQALPTALWIAEPELDKNGKQKVKENGRPRINKAPRNCDLYNISNNKPEQWASFDACVVRFDPKTAFGIGCLLLASSRIVGIDIDDFADFDAGSPVHGHLQKAQARGIYCERSPSGTGLRLFVKGTLPKAGRRKGGIELYADRRFLTVTGAPEWSGDVIEGQWLVDALLEVIEGTGPTTGTRSDASSKAGASGGAGTSQAGPDYAATVAELIKVIGQRHPTLWAGKWDQETLNRGTHGFGNNMDKAYPSQSEADYALVGYTARAAMDAGLTGDQLRDAIIEVFSQSGLYRPDKDTTLRNNTVPKIVAALLGSERPNSDSGTDWPELRDLPPRTSPVPTLDVLLLPKTMRDVVVDAMSRMQVPPEVIATPIIISLGSVIGKSMAIQPRNTDDSWFEYPNLWGCAIMPPGMLKSPAMNEGTKFIRELDEQWRRKHAADMAQWEASEVLRKITEVDEKAEIRALKKQGHTAQAMARAASFAAMSEPPVRRRLIITDATPEARLKILAENEDGVMLIRDELNGHLKQFERDGHENSRAQELQYFDGKQDYSDDRMKRGGLFARAPRLAMYGNLQPSVLEALLLDRAQSGKGADDGYSERLFQLAVMPQFAPDYTGVQRAPDRTAENALRQVFQAAHDLPKASADTSGRHVPTIVTFEPDAEDRFQSIFVGLEKLLRSPSPREPRLAGHKGKFRGTLAKLALIIAFCEDPGVTKVPLAALDRASKLLTFYLGHARAIYALAEPSDMLSAHELLVRIKSDRLSSEFAPREVQMMKWKRLRTLEEVEGAIRILLDHGVLKEKIYRNATGGRPSRAYLVNSAIVGKRTTKAA